MKMTNRWGEKKWVKKRQWRSVMPSIVNSHMRRIESWQLLGCCSVQRQRCQQKAKPLFKMQMIRVHMQKRMSVAPATYGIVFLRCTLLIQSSTRRSDNRPVFKRPARKRVTARAKRWTARASLRAKQESREVVASSPYMPRTVRKQLHSVSWMSVQPVHSEKDSDWFKLV